MRARVVAVARASEHRFSKETQPSIRLIVGEGVEGDAHRGSTVKHRSRVAADPTQPNLRQVHLIHEELFSEVSQLGFQVAPAELGENITTRGLDLLSLPRGTVLSIGEQARVEVTGLRNPCAQIDQFQTGLLGAVVEKTDQGLVRKTGVMAIVIREGIVRPNDTIEVRRPSPPFLPLERV